MGVPTHECIQELAKWSVEHHRHMHSLVTKQTMREIVRRHYPGEGEATEFLQYLASAPGQRNFREALREHKAR